MRQQIKHLIVAAASLVGAAFLCTMAAALTLEELSWQTAAFDENDFGGATVIFEARFVNNNEVPSDPVSGTLSPQPFGAFVSTPKDLICTFEVPSLPGGGEYTVTCEVPLDDLPKDAKRLLPWQGETGCDPDNFWAGGVEASWTGDGDGIEFVHRGTLQVCPRLGPSYIRILVDCPEQAGWFFDTKACGGGFSTDLVDFYLNEAPNPLPPGEFHGWICVDTNSEVPFGENCPFSVFMTCGEVTAEIHMTAVTCDCDRPVPVEPSTWGRIKQHMSR